MITGIIQARLNSTRLPKKVLLPFGERCVLQEVLYQAKLSMVDQVVLAIPTVHISNTQPYPGILCDNWFAYHGDENDLISRYYKAAVKYHADPIVRITSDCPLILPEVIDLVIKEYFKHNWDYTFNRCDDKPGGFADGLDVEVFSFALLQKAYVLAKKREHMTWLRVKGHSFQVKPDKDYGECTSINTKEDYVRALEILKRRT